LEDKCIQRERNGRKRDHAGNWGSSAHTLQEPILTDQFLFYFSEHLKTDGKRALGWVSINRGCEPPGKTLFLAKKLKIKKKILTPNLVSKVLY
jgi:hypothetical protein